MCGILGSIPAVEPLEFLGALRTLIHRGPDGEGVWQDSGDVILGHRRLAILDKSDDASQPMHYLNRYHIVFNGEIYNFLEIRRELELVGHRFQSGSDTEVLIAAFSQWRSSCLTRLNGMWAFAIWDSVEKLLFLSRDRMGEKPLYYLHVGSKFVFASEQKALLPFLREVQPSDRFHILCKDPYEYEGTEESLFKGIHRFPAAHYAWFKNGKLNKSRYWAPLQQLTAVPSVYSEQIDVLRELLLDSCRIRMRADVPIGTALSGGVDSSVVAAGIAIVGKGQRNDRIPMDWQNAFTSSFPGSVMDESIHASAVANHLGIQLSKIAIHPYEHIGKLEQWAYQFEDIHEVNPIPHIILYHEMRKKGVLVSLDGHGGDELFCGYESSILHALPDAAPRKDALCTVLDTYRNCHPKNSLFNCMSIPEILLYLAKRKVRKIFGGNPRSVLRQTVFHLGSLNSHLLDLSVRTVLPTLLRNYDRYSMINGIEVRIPLLDHRIVDFAFSIPWSSKIRNGFSKSILRDAAAPWLPSNILYRKEKIGFAPPIGEWMHGPLREYLLDEINSTSFQQANLIRPTRLSAAIKGAILTKAAGNLYGTERIWKEFGIYLWEKAFLHKQQLKISRPTESWPAEIHPIVR